MEEPRDATHIADDNADALVMSRDHPIRLPVFEGPLDLLLYLIRKNEIDIHDIPIGAVTKQYLDVLRSYKTMNLDVAGEFFVMAATLMVIKSRMLLPPEKITAGSDEPEETDDESNLDPRWQLVRQLIQYKRIKESAGHLSGLIELRQGFAQRLVPPPAGDAAERPVANADRLELWNTFNNILRRLSERAGPAKSTPRPSPSPRAGRTSSRAAARRKVSPSPRCSRSARRSRSSSPPSSPVWSSPGSANSSSPRPATSTTSFARSAADDPLVLDADAPRETDHEHTGENDDAFSPDEDVESPVDEDDFEDEDFYDEAPDEPAPDPAGEKSTPDEDTGG